MQRNFVLHIIQTKLVLLIKVSVDQVVLLFKTFKRNLAATTELNHNKGSKEYQT